MRRPNPAGRIVIAGSLAQKPRHGGHAWVFLQYLLGLQRLGWDVLFLDRLDAGMSVDHAGRPAAVADSFNARTFFEIARRFDLQGRVALLHDGGALGLERRQILERTREAALLIDVMGYLRDDEILGAAARRVYLDIDPGFTQMWSALGLARPFDHHDDLVTVGERLGLRDCSIPDCGRRWIPTRPPVVLAHWPQHPPRGGAFTTVGTWRGRYAPVDFGGETYGLRAHSFRPLASLARDAPGRFELALDIDPADVADLELLHRHGWQLVSPLVAARDPWVYRDYIARSAGELMVAKAIYVKSRSGWFSDRSVCYLASGRPVVAQDTGFSELVPTGEGLLSFRDLGEARAAVDRVRREPARHATAARRVAREHFDSDNVLSRLLSRLGVAA